MTNIEVMGFISVTIVTLGFIGAFIARISKLETRADVCDERHKETEKKLVKQDAVNLRIEEHHIEVMKAISRIDTKIDKL